MGRGARMIGGEIRAAEVELAGRIERGQLVVWRRLTLLPSAVFAPDMVSFRDLEIAEGARWVPGQAVHCQTMAVAGYAEGEFDVEHGLWIRASGCVVGTVRCQRLRVDEGGGLIGDFRVTREL